MVQWGAVGGHRCSEHQEHPRTGLRYRLLNEGIAGMAQGNNAIEKRLWDAADELDPRDRWFRTHGR